MSDTTPERDGPVVSDSTRQLQRDIENTREQLGDTVEALAHKVNVPARAKDTVHEAVATAQVKAAALTDDAAALANRAVSALPPPARSRVDQLVVGVRQRPLPAVLAAAGVLLVVTRLLRRGR